MKFGCLTRGVIMRPEVPKMPALPAVDMEPGCKNPFTAIINLAPKARMQRAMLMREFQGRWVEEMHKELREVIRIENQPQQVG